MWRRTVRLSAEDRGRLQAAVDSSTATRAEVAALTEAVAALQASYAPVPGETRLRRTVPAGVIFVLTLMLAAALIWRGAEAFGDPTVASAGEGGSLFVGVEAEPGEADQDEPIQVGVWYDIARGDVDYQFAFPKKDLGKRFVVIVIGPDALTAMSTVADAPTPHLESCSGDDSCQLIIGTVAPGPFKHICTGDLDAKDLVDDYIPVLISGSASLGSSPDWAHETIAFPSIGLTYTQRGVTSLNGIPLPESYRFLAGGHTCVTTEVPVGADVTDVSSGGIITDSESTVRWAASSAVAQSLVLKRQNAHRQGNVSIAVGGALAGLAIGFMPTLVESAIGARRRSRVISRLRQ